MAKMVQKTFKIPEAWSKELTKLMGRRMAETGEEQSFAGMVKEALDEQFGLSEATGLDMEGSTVPEPANEHPAAKEA